MKQSAWLVGFKILNYLGEESSSQKSVSGIGSGFPLLVRSRIFLLLQQKTKIFSLCARLVQPPNSGRRNPTGCPQPASPPRRPPPPRVSQKASRPEPAAARPLPPTASTRRIFAPRGFFRARRRRRGNAASGRPRRGGFSPLPCCVAGGSQRRGAKPPSRDPPRGVPIIPAPPSPGGKSSVWHPRPAPRQLLSTCFTKSSRFQALPSDGNEASSTKFLLSAAVQERAFLAPSLSFFSLFFSLRNLINASKK